MPSSHNTYDSQSKADSALAQRFLALPVGLTATDREGRT